MTMRNRQKTQYEHDLKNHFDILSLSRIDRLKHYGLHFSKYAGRFARGDAELKSRQETLIDAFLVSLSAANALNQALPEIKPSDASGSKPSDLEFTDYAGRFADACEKIDHLEEFRSIALDANAKISEWIIKSAAENNLNLDNLVNERRAKLAQRLVYAPEP